jgi:hypothetical protein
MSNEKNINTITTIKTEFFNSFMWKRLPLEHNYITIVFCLDDYKNTDNTDDFINNINDENIKKAIKYILNIMPYQCVIDVDNYNNFLYYKNNDEKQDSNEDLFKKIEDGKLPCTEDEINKIKNNLKYILNKKTFIFNYYSDNVQNDKNFSYMYNISVNEHFNDTHKLCIGEIQNIPKSILSVADYIFFDSKETINKYLESHGHFLRVSSSNASLYLIDKCNYEYYQLFHFNKHLNSV